MSPARAARVALQLSGHTHGGQVRLFGWSPVVAVAVRQRSPTATSRINCDVIVSGGLGCSIMPFRLGVPPEIVLVTLGGGKAERLMRRPTHCSPCAARYLRQTTAHGTRDNQYLDGEIRDGRHHMQIRVYYEDTDFSGIVYHANYLRFMERGRTNHLRLMGAEQHALFAEAQAETPGFAFVVRSMQIDFLKPARMDDVLDVVTWPVAVKGASITLAQEVRRGERCAGQGRGAGRLHQRGAGAADPESAADLMKADVV